MLSVSLSRSIWIPQNNHQELRITSLSTKRKSLFPHCVFSLPFSYPKHAQDMRVIFSKWDKHFVEIGRGKRQGEKQIHSTLKKIKKQYVNKSIGNEYFKIDDLVLKSYQPHEEKARHTKFQELWLGPYVTIEKLGVGTYNYKI